MSKKKEVNHEGEVAELHCLIGKLKVARTALDQPQNQQVIASGILKLLLNAAASFWGCRASVITMGLLQVCVPVSGANLQNRRALHGASLGGQLLLCRLSHNSGNP